MGYKFLKLHLEWTGAKYLNRLELGDASLNAPIDLRFIDDAGWIENVHSVFFSVNGRDAYYPTDTGGLISTSDTGDLVFFDPSNAVGRTLSQLYSGGGLWEVNGSYSQLITARPIDMQGEEITKATQVKGSLNADFSLQGSNAADTDWIEFLKWDHVNEKITLGSVLDMATHKISGVVDPTSDQEAATKKYVDDNAGGGLWEVNGSYSQLITARPIDMQGEEITKIADLKGSLGVDIGIHGSNAAHSAWIEFLNWDHTNEKILIESDLDVNNHDILDVKVIKAYSTNDLSFWDNTNGTKTLSDLASAGMWEVNGSYSQLITARPIDMQGDEITKALEVKGSLGVDFSMAGSDSADTAWFEFLNWDHASNDLELKAPDGGDIDHLINGVSIMRVNYLGLDMNDKKIYDLDFIDFSYRTSNPSASKGRVYFNHSSNKLMVCEDGTNWRSVTTS